MEKFENYLKEFEQNIETHTNEIVNNIKNFHKSTGMNGFVIGMSGGLDCAVVGALCSLAKVPIIALTIPYEPDKSDQRKTGIKHAKELCDKFNIPLYTADITDTVNSIYANGLTALGVSDMSKANVLPRVRMTHLYYAAQNTGRLVIGTGNLSEIVMGYFTKWGDGVFDFNPVKHLTKTEMYILAKYIGVPESIINKAPSADLWDNQTDENEMGIGYLDLDRYILTGEGSEEIANKVNTAFRKNSHKYVSSFGDIWSRCKFLKKP